MERKGRRIGILMFRVTMTLKQLPFLFLLVFWILVCFIVAAVAGFFAVVWMFFVWVVFGLLLVFSCWDFFPFYVRGIDQFLVF